MYRMNSGSLTRGKWFQPESQPFVLQERDSSCTIQLGPDDPEIAFTDWILDDSWPEGNYVWRVKSIDDQDNTETRTIGLALGSSLPLSIYFLRGVHRRC